MARKLGYIQQGPNREPAVTNALNEGQVSARLRVATITPASTSAKPIR